MIRRTVFYSDLQERSENSAISLNTKMYADSLTGAAKNRAAFKGSNPGSLIGNIKPTEKSKAAIDSVIKSPASVKIAPPKPAGGLLGLIKKNPLATAAAVGAAGLGLGALALKKKNTPQAPSE